MEESFKQEKRVLQLQIEYLHSKLEAARKSISESEGRLEQLRGIDSKVRRHICLLLSYNNNNVVYTFRLKKNLERRFLQKEN